MRPKRRGEGCELSQCGLLDDYGNDGAILCQMRRNGQQQRTRARDNHPLAGDRITALHQSLQAASTEDTRQRPPWKRQKPFSSPGGQNQLVEAELFYETAGTRLLRGLQGSRGLGAEHAAASEHLGSGPPKPFP